MKRLNLKLAAGLATVLLGGTVGVYALHGYQMERNAGLVLEQAQFAASNDDLTEAGKYYGQYLHYRPHDAPVHAEFALIQARLAKQPEATPREVVAAYDALDEAVRKNPSRHDLRRLLVEFQMMPGVQRIADARDQLAVLLDAAPADTDLQLLLARCHASGRYFDEAIEVLARLTGFDPANGRFDAERATAPGNVDAYVLLSGILRQQSADPALPESCLRQAVAVNPGSAEAHLQHLLYLRRYRWSSDEARQQAQRSLEKALQLQPERVDLLLAAVDVATTERQSRAARDALERALERDPSDLDILRALAIAARKQKDLEGAIHYVRQALDQSPRHLVLLELLADLQIQQEKPDEAQATLKTWREAGAHPVLVELAEARLLALQAQYEQAAKGLEKARPLAEQMGLSAQTNRLLGECYGRIGQPQQMLEAYERAVKADPSDVTSRIGQGTALYRLGQREPALKILQAAETAMGEDSLLAIPVAWQALLELRIADRRWPEVEAMMAAASRAAKWTDAQQAAVSAELLVQKGEPEAALEILSKAQKASPDDLNLTAQRIRLELQLHGPQQARPILGEARKKFGAVLPLSLLEAELIIRESSPGAAKKLAVLESHAEALSTDEGARLRKSLGAAMYVVGDLQQAERLWTQVLQSEPRDSATALALFELARLRADTQGMARALQHLRAAGESADINYAEAALILTKASEQPQPDGQSLKNAQRLIEQALAERPRWPDALRLSAELQRLEGNLVQATETTRKALEVSPRQPVLVRTMVQLLLAQGLHHEAREYLQQLELTQRAGLERATADLEILSGNVEAGLAQAEQIARTTQRPEDLLWYGVRQAQAGRPQQALETLRKATQLGPQSPEAWLALVGLLQTEGAPDEAERALIEAAGKVPAERSNRLLASGYELLGKQELADLGYEKAVSQAPENIAVRQAAASYYIRTGRTQQAHRHVDAVLAMPKGNDAASTWARRAKAELLATGSYAEFQAAMKLLDSADADREDALLRARLLARRDLPATRSEAARLLQQLDEQEGLQPTDRLLLARLLERGGQWTQARRMLLQLLSEQQQGTDGNLLAAYVSLLIEHDEFGEADPWLKRLHHMEPNSPRAAILKARLLHGQGRRAEAIAAIRALVPGPLSSGQESVLRVAAAAFEQLDEHAEAQRLYEELVVLQPQAKSELAAFMAGRGDADAVLRLVSEMGGEKPSGHLIQLALEALRTSAEPASAETLQQVRHWLESAQAAEPKNVSIQLMRAELEQIEGKHDSAIAIYRRLLANPGLGTTERAVISNNLAYLLAMHSNDPQSAMPHIQAAIETLGPLPDLLDTRGIVHLQAGDTPAALADISTAAGDSGASAAKQLHLALAQEAAGDRSGAVRSLTRAEEFRLPAVPLEQEAYRSLKSRLQP